MRLHVVGLPHTQATKEFSHCAYTAKERNFVKMMMAEGHQVYLYHGDQCDILGVDLVPCITEDERLASLKGKFYVEGSFNSSDMHWRRFNATVTAEIYKRFHPRDIICLIAGLAQRTIADAFSGEAISCEYGVGYTGTFTKYRAFESYAWMHSIYGAESGIPKLHGYQGQWYDTVIPGYFDPDDFAATGPIGHPDDDDEPYLLFVGRMNNDKGVDVAVQTAEAAGMKLIMAGHGPHIRGKNTECIGVIGPEKRRDLMLRATALLAPTKYLEPFGNVAVEAQACGTPVISTDWGAFTETVEHGLTGFRCRTLQQFVDAVEAVDNLDHNTIRTRAHRLYSLKAVAPRYTEWFERLNGLWSVGWNALRPNSKIDSLANSKGELIQLPRKAVG